MCVYVCLYVRICLKNAPKMKAQSEEFRIVQGQKHLHVQEVFCTNSAMPGH